MPCLAKATWLNGRALALHARDCVFDSMWCVVFRAVTVPKFRYRFGFGSVSAEKRGFGFGFRDKQKQLEWQIKMTFFAINKWKP